MRALQLALASAWAGVVAVALCMRRPLPVGRAAALSPALSRALSPARSAPSRTSQPAARSIQIRLGFAAGSVLAAAVIALTGPVGLVVVAAGVAVAPRLRRRAAVRRHERDVVDGLPEVVDLLALGISSGLGAGSVVALMAERLVGVWGEAMRSAHAARANGAPFVESVERLVTVAGAPAEGLRRALVDQHHYGVALLPALDRLALEARLARRRRAEEAARRVPVLLLFPLVLCVLPAFVLLTVVPLLVGATSSLHL